MDLGAFEAIDWDGEEDEQGNLAHCLRHGVTERVVAEVLAEDPVEIRLRLEHAHMAVVGPDRSQGQLWTLLLATSLERGDWLRPVTGWRSKSGEIAAGEQATGRTWHR